MRVPEKRYEKETVGGSDFHGFVVRGELGFRKPRANASAIAMADPGRTGHERSDRPDAATDSATRQPLTQPATARVAVCT